MKKTKFSLFNRKMILLGILPGMAAYLLFFVLPSCGTALFSLTDITQVPGQQWKFIGLANYKELLLLSNKRDLLNAFQRTMVYCISTTTIQTVLALAVALLLNNKRLHGRSAYRTVVFMPTILGVTVTGLCLKMFFSIDGPANSFLRAVTGEGSSFFGDPQIALGMVIFAQIWMSLGYEMVIFLAGLQNIPSELYEAAAVDGASRWQSFWCITLPQIWQTVIVNVTLCVVGSLSSFQIILMTTGGSTATKTLAMWVYEIAFGLGVGKNANVGRQGYAAAVQMLLFFIILISMLLVRGIMNRFYREDE